MLKKIIIITLVILAVIIATLNQGIIAATCSLVAFSLLFYFVSTQKSESPSRDDNE